MNRPVRNLKGQKIGIPNLEGQVSFRALAVADAETDRDFDLRLDALLDGGRQFSFSLKASPTVGLLIPSHCGEPLCEGTALTVNKTDLVNTLRRMADEIESAD